MNLRRAHITGFLNCSGGNFAANGDVGNALTCDGVRVSGDAFLNEGFKARGEV